jgi:DNA-binding LytR/AlgR family response regulator
LVKKLGKEFLVKTKNIEWVEAYGNYANLHIDNEIYPMRRTMSDFILKSRHHGLIRVHRSFAVSLNKVHFIEPLVSGDAEIVMQSGGKYDFQDVIKLTLKY